MLNKFEKVENAIANAYTDEESNFQMPPTTPHFNKALKKTTSTLSDINYIVVQLQMQMAMSSRCQQLKPLMISYAEDSRVIPEVTGTRILLGRHTLHLIL
jgi:hypothetical protein